MRRVVVKTALILSLAWLGLPGEISAQNREKSWELFPYIGYYSLSAPGFGDSIEIQLDTPMAGQTETTFRGSSI